MIVEPGTLWQTGLNSVHQCISVKVPTNQVEFNRCPLTGGQYRHGHQFRCLVDIGNLDVHGPAAAAMAIAYGENNPIIKPGLKKRGCPGKHADYGIKRCPLRHIGSRIRQHIAIRIASQKRHGQQLIFGYRLVGNRCQDRP